jgi:hypothetical protein
MIDRVRGRSVIGGVSGPTPTVKVWPVTGNEAITHPIGGPLRQSGGTPWPHDGFTIRRLRANEVTLQAPTTDIGRQRKAIIDQKLAEGDPKSDT